MAEGERHSPPDSSEDSPPATQNFIIPKKEIHTVPDMGKWKRSQAYADYIGFILTLNEGVKGKKLTFEYTVSEAIEKLVALLNTLDRWIDETPPVDQPSRFGNKAYRTWYAKLDEEAENLVATVVPTHLAAAVPEVAVYLKEAVGNSTRIDYGTGHEAAFAAFLCCLCKIGVLRVDDQIAIVFKVFNRYLEVMRKLQKTYRMEPAGSQGVWGLDDFQFLPFIWGSSQLIDHPYLEPRHFVDEKAVNENHKDYMFLECILFITEMKTGPFAEHSNQLWNISAVPSWSKVNQGLIRMYKAEAGGLRYHPEDAHLLTLGHPSSMEGWRGRFSGLASTPRILSDRVPGEVPGDPALQVWEPAAHPSCHVVLGGAEQPEPSRLLLCLPPPPQLRPPPHPFPLFFLFDERLFTGMSGEREVEGGS
ncbi:serine/threonine-protein phosphatase 2A activator isoform X1 [Vicugna pacos]|uniref:Serine/threonine-protein phosphatase 2A activator n=1 Tax=Vicugna pacos TaxID=30538 RepID=A0ABM5D618_VICPA